MLLLALSLPTVILGLFISNCEELEESVNYINSKERPLGLYYFGDNKEEEEFVLNNTTSGGVTLKNVKKIASTGVKRISVGQITHSAPTADFKLDLY